MYKERNAIIYTLLESELIFPKSTQKWHKSSSALSAEDLIV